MPVIASVGTATPPYRIGQNEARQFAGRLFANSFKDIERLLPVFENGQVHSRYFSAPLEWFGDHHDAAEKNQLYVKTAETLGERAIRHCLEQYGLQPEDVDHFIFVSSTGLATPSMDARLINRLNMRENTKRTPIWGLGCAGGAVGLSRAWELAMAYPDSRVVILALELCGLTFLFNDRSKSNLIATSLFADGAAAALILGDHAAAAKKQQVDKPLPSIIDNMSTLWKDTLDVMGWDVTNDGMKVVFSRSIPAVVNQWMKPAVERFLTPYALTPHDIQHYVLHPGGIKVIQAYEDSLGIHEEKTIHARKVLQNYGNMSSATVLFVLRQIMENNCHEGDYGLVSALGPGFSSELLLIRWS